MTSVRCLVAIDRIATSSGMLPPASTTVRMSSNVQRIASVAGARPNSAVIAAALSVLSRLSTEGRSASGEENFFDIAEREYRLHREWEMELNSSSATASPITWRLKPLSDTGVEVDILDGDGVSPPKPSVTNMQKWFGP